MPKGLQYITVFRFPSGFPGFSARFQAFQLTYSTFHMFPNLELSGTFSYDLNSQSHTALHGTLQCVQIVIYRVGQINAYASYMLPYLFRDISEYGELLPSSMMRTGTSTTVFTRSD